MRLSCSSEQRNRAHKCCSDPMPLKQSATLLLCFIVAYDFPVVRLKSVQKWPASSANSANGVAPGAGVGREGSHDC
jgi:hypothetical protein